jgi:hypothetical protein
METERAELHDEGIVNALGLVRFGRAMDPASARVASERSPSHLQRISLTGMQSGHRVNPPRALRRARTLFC